MKTSFRGAVHALALGCWVLAIAQTPRAQAADSVVTTTTYEYGAAGTLQPTAVVVEGSDGAYRRTETRYAFEEWPAMAEFNMLVQVHRTAVLGEVGNIEGCRRTRWMWWDASFWAPAESFEGCSALGEEVTALTVLDYDGSGRVVETEDSRGLHTQYTYDGEGRLTSVVRDGDGLGGTAPTSYEHETIYEYDDRGFLERVTDENGNYTGYQYDALGRLAEVTDTIDRSVMRYEYEYSSESDPSGDYRPDRPNRVTMISYGIADAASTEWSDGLGRPVGTTSYWSPSHDDVVVTEYDAAGRVRTAWRPARVAAVSNRTLPSDPGSTWDGGVYASDFATESEAYWDAQPGISSGDAGRAYTTTTYEPDPLGRPREVQAPGVNGDVLTYRYGVGRPDAEFPGVRPEGPAPDMAYADIEDAAGRTTRVYSDGLGQERFVLRGAGTPDAALTETVYDAAGQVVEVRHPNFFRPRPLEAAGVDRSVYDVDTRGLLTSTTTVDAGTVRMRYDDAGLLRLRQDADQAVQNGSPYGHASYYAYDALGRLVLESQGQLVCPFGSADVEARSCGGQPLFTAQTDEWVRLLAYDNPRHHPWEDPEQAGASYDPNGRPFYAPPGFSFANSVGRLAQETYKSDGRWHSTAYAYDRQGRVAVRATFAPLADGLDDYRHTTYTYDYGRTGLLRDVLVEVGPHVFRRAYTYEPNGQVARAYAGVDRLPDSTVSLSLEAQYKYDAAGALTYTRFHKIQHAQTGISSEGRLYDITGRLIRIGVQPVAAPGPGDLTESPLNELIAYAPGGLVGSVTSGSASSGPFAASGSAFANSPASAPATSRVWRYTFGYDDLGRLEGGEYRIGAAILGHYSLGGLRYDANGNIMSLRRAAPHFQYGSVLADSLVSEYVPGTNRLYISADPMGRHDGDVGTQEPTPWDAVGSRFTYTPNGAVYEQLEYDGMSASCQYKMNEISYIYDKMTLFNLPQILRLEYRTWSNVSGSGCVQNRYSLSARYMAYDPSGNRVRYRTYALGSDAPGNVDLWDGGRRVGAINAATGALRYWNTASGRIEWDADTGTHEWYVYRRDHLGTVRAVQREGDGGVVEARDYYPFGAEMPGRQYVDGPQTREGFTGHEEDRPSGRLLHAGARYYMPALGRWTSVDPLASSFPRHSPYNYALNNPLSLTDPTGMAPEAGACPPDCPDFSGWNAFRPAATMLEQAYRRVEQGVRSLPSTLTPTTGEVRTLAAGVGITAGVTGLLGTGCGAVAGCVAAAGGTMTLSGIVSTSGVVATAATTVEVVATGAQVVTGETSLLEGVVSAGTNVIFGKVAGDFVHARLTLQGTDILAPTGLDAALDASLAATRQNVNRLALGAGRSVNALAGAAATPVMLRGVRQLPEVTVTADRLPGWGVIRRR